VAQANRRGLPGRQGTPRCAEAIGGVRRWFSGLRRVL